MAAERDRLAAEREDLEEQLQCAEGSRAAAVGVEQCAFKKFELCCFSGKSNTQSITHELQETSLKGGSVPEALAIDRVHSM